MSPVLWMLAAALSSSAITLGAAFIVYSLWGRRTLDAELLQIQDEFEKRVRTGVLAAGRELLPEFRREVAAGFRDALSQSYAAGLAEDAAKVVSSGTTILEKSLSSLFGLNPRK